MRVVVEHCLKPGGCHRLTGQEALEIVAPRPAQVAELFRSLDTLRRHLETELVSQIDKALCNGASLRVNGQVSNE
jgi:hypothetical protein